jgi:hypothetical protein
MSDDKSQRGGRDRSRVASGEKWEVNYMTQKYNVSKEEVEKAVQAVGNSREKVEQYLKKNKGSR